MNIPTELLSIEIKVVKSTKQSICRAILKISKKIDDLRSLTYSLDACYVGFYFWVAGFSIRIGGTETEDQPYFYPYVVPTFIGFGFALPNYFSWHTPFAEYKFIEQSRMSHKSDRGFDRHLPNSL